MNKPMRRKNKERRDVAFMNDVLTRADDIYVAFTSENSEETAPYVIPLNFAHMDGKIYIHCALEGRKLECIRKNPKVGFSTSIDVQILREEATTHYKCVVGTGTAHIVEDAQEKGLALDAIATHFGAGCEIPASPKNVTRTGIIRIDIETLCGKESPPPLS